MKQWNHPTSKFYLLTFLVFSLLIPTFLSSDEAPDYYFILSEKIKASASSVLVEPGKSKTRYSADKAMDGKTDTFWCEGKEDDGIGETIKLTWKPTLIEGILVGHGVLLNRNYYQLNNRIKEYEATVTYSSGRSKVFKGSFGDYSCQNVCDSKRIDGVEMEECQKEHKNDCNFESVGEGGMVGGESITGVYGCSTGVEIKILSVYPGKKFKDTCISEINLRIPAPKWGEERIAEVNKDQKACK